MRYLVVTIALASCATSPEAPGSSASLSGQATVDSARATQGQVFYGAPYHKWTITLSTIDGCAGDDLASVEINTLSGVTALPLGPIDIRTSETDIQTLPSAYLRYMAAPVTSGVVTIDSASAAYVTGSWAASLTIGGALTDVTATFGAPVCP